MEVGEVSKGIRWSAEAGGPPKVRIGGVSGRGRGPTLTLRHYHRSHKKFHVGSGHNSGRHKILRLAFILEYNQRK